LYSALGVVRMLGKKRFPSQRTQNDENAKKR
jgi:hypothetical protein